MKKLRKLTFPVAVLTPGGLRGGRPASLHRTSHFDFNLASYYLRGGYADARIFDANGKEYEVESIRLYRTKWWRHFLRLVDDLFISRRNAEDVVDVDMDLRHIGSPSLEAFCERMRAEALPYPRWWNRDLTKDENQAEIILMFDGCERFAEAIDAIGVFDSPSGEKLPGRSDKVLDLPPALRPRS